MSCICIVKHHLKNVYFKTVRVNSLCVLYEYYTFYRETLQIGTMKHLWY